MMVLGIATALVVVGLALPRSPAVPAVDHIAPGQLLPPTPVPQASLSVSAVVPPASEPVKVKKTLAPKPQAIRPVESAKAAGTSAVAPAPAEPEPARSAALAPPQTTGPSPVTITGCLEMSVDATEFRLTDTDGVEAPRSRSWRSGFLKKQSATIALVEQPDAHELQAQVGKRVAATGLLTSRSLKVSALRIVTPSCS